MTILVSRKGSDQRNVNDKSTRIIKSTCIIINMQEVVSIVATRLIKHWIESTNVWREPNMLFTLYSLFLLFLWASLFLSVYWRYALNMLPTRPVGASFCDGQLCCNKGQLKQDPPSSNLLLIHVSGDWPIKLFFVGACLSIMREGCTSSIAVFSLFKLISLVTKNEVSSFDDFYIVLFQTLTDWCTSFTLVLQDDYQSRWCHGHQSPG